MGLYRLAGELQRASWGLSMRFESFQGVSRCSGGITTSIRRFLEIFTRSSGELQGALKRVSQAFQCVFGRFLMFQEVS